MSDFSSGDEKPAGNWTEVVSSGQARALTIKPQVLAAKRKRDVDVKAQVVGDPVHVHCAFNFSLCDYLSVAGHFIKNICNAHTKVFTWFPILPSVRYYRAMNQNFLLTTIIFILKNCTINVRNKIRRTLPGSSPVIGHNKRYFSLIYPDCFR